MHVCYFKGTHIVLGTVFVIWQAPNDFHRGTHIVLGTVLSGRERERERDGRNKVHSLFGRDEACKVGELGRARQALPCQAPPSAQRFAPVIQFVMCWDCQLPRGSDQHPVDLNLQIVLQFLCTEMFASMPGRKEETLAVCVLN